MKNYLASLGSWLVAKYAAPALEVAVQPIPAIDASILTGAVALVERWTGVEASGEYKRHAVLADMMKLFPGAEKRVICLAIELAVWGMK